MSHLKISHLEKSFDKNKILHGISFEVNSGEFVSLLGPSGCGKSTTLRCIAGLERPDGGQSVISIDGQTLSSAQNFVEPEERNFGMVFQNYAVWPHLNVFDNVAFPLRQRKKHLKLSTAEIKERVDETLALVQLTGLSARFGHELSGGQQQRVALARAIAMSPRFLLLDEPLSNLDVLLREELRIEIQRIQKKLKMTTVLVTHDQREALSLSDRIIILNKGHVDAIGKPQDLYEKSPTPFVAEFLAGGQSLEFKSGTSFMAFPRKWKSTTEKRAESKRAAVISRLYLGNEYEYWAAVEDFTRPVKFFSPHIYADGAEIFLS